MIHIPAYLHQQFFRFPLFFGLMRRKQQLPQLSKSFFDRFADRSRADAKPLCQFAVAPAFQKMQFDQFFLFGRKLYQQFLHFRKILLQLLLFKISTRRLRRICRQHFLCKFTAAFYFIRAGHFFILMPAFPFTAERRIRLTDDKSRQLLEILPLSPLFQRLYYSNPICSPSSAKPL